MRPLLLLALAALLLATTNAQAGSHTPSDVTTQKQACDISLVSCEYNKDGDCIPGALQPPTCQPPEACAATSSNPTAKCGPDPFCPAQVQLPSCTPFTFTQSAPTCAYGPEYRSQDAAYSCTTHAPYAGPGCTGLGGTWTKGTCKGASMLSVIRPQHNVFSQNLCDSPTWVAQWNSNLFWLPSDYNHANDAATWNVYFLKAPDTTGQLVGSYAKTAFWASHNAGAVDYAATYGFRIEYQGPEGTISSSPVYAKPIACAKAAVTDVQPAPATACVPRLTASIAFTGTADERREFRHFTIERRETTASGAPIGGAVTMQIPTTYPYLRTTGAGYDFDDFSIEPGRHYEYRALPDYGNRGQAVFGGSDHGGPSNACPAPRLTSIATKDTQAPAAAATAYGQANSREASVTLQWTWVQWEPAMDWWLQDVRLLRDRTPGSTVRDRIDPYAGNHGTQSGELYAYFQPPAAAKTLEFIDYTLRGDETYAYQIQVTSEAGARINSNPGTTHAWTAPGPVSVLDVQSLAYVHKDFPGGPQQGMPPPPGGYPVDLMQNAGRYGELAIDVDPAPHRGAPTTKYQILIEWSTGSKTSCWLDAPALEGGSLRMPFLYPNDAATCQSTASVQPVPRGTTGHRITAFAYNQYGRGPAVQIQIDAWSTDQQDGKLQDKTSDPANDGREEPFTRRTSTWSRQDTIHEWHARAASIQDEPPGFRDDTKTTTTGPVTNAEPTVAFTIDATPCAQDWQLTLYSYHALEERALGYRGPNLPTHYEARIDEANLYLADRTITSHDPRTHDPRKPIQRFQDAWIEQGTTGAMDQARLQANLVRHDVANLQNAATVSGKDYRDGWTNLPQQGHALGFNGAGTFCLVDGLLALADLGPIQPDSEESKSVQYPGTRQKPVLPQQAEVQGAATLVDLEATEYRFTHTSQEKTTSQSEVYDVHGDRRGPNCHCTHQTTDLTETTEQFLQSFTSRYNYHAELRSDGSTTPLAGIVSAEFGGDATGFGFSKYARAYEEQAANPDLWELQRINRLETPAATAIVDHDTLRPTNPKPWIPARDTKTVVQPYLELDADAGIQTMQGTLVPGNMHPVAIFGGFNAFHRDSATNLEARWHTTYEWTTKRPDGSWQPIPSDPETPWIPNMQPYTMSEYDALLGRATWRIHVTAKLEHAGRTIDTIDLTTEREFLLDALSLQDASAHDFGFPVYKEDQSPTGAGLLRGFWYWTKTAPWDAIQSPGTDHPYTDAAGKTHLLRGQAHPNVDGRDNTRNALRIHTPERDHFYFLSEDVRGSQERAWDAQQGKYVDDPEKTVEARSQDNVLAIHYSTNPRTDYRDGEAVLVFRLYDAEDLQGPLQYTSGVGQGVGRGLMDPDGESFPTPGKDARLTYRLMPSAGTQWEGRDRPEFHRTRLLVEYTDGTWNQNTPYPSRSYEWQEMQLPLAPGKHVKSIYLQTTPYIGSIDPVARFQAVHNIYLDTLTLDWTKDGTRTRIPLYAYDSTTTPDIELVATMTRNAGDYWFHGEFHTLLKYDDALEEGDDCKITKKVTKSRFIFFSSTDRETEDTECDPSTGESYLFQLAWPSPVGDPPTSPGSTALQPFASQGLVTGISATNDEGTASCLRYAGMTRNDTATLSCLHGAALASSDREPMLDCLRHAPTTVGQQACVQGLLFDRADSPYLAPFSGSDIGGYGAAGNYYPNRPTYEYAWQIAPILSFQEPDSQAAAPRFDLVGRNWGQSPSQNTRALHMFTPGAYSTILVEAQQSEHDPVYGTYLPTEDQRSIRNLDGSLVPFTPVPSMMLNGTPSSAFPDGPFYDPAPITLRADQRVTIDLSERTSWTTNGLRQAILSRYDPAVHTHVTVKPYPTDINVCYHYANRDNTWRPFEDLEADALNEEANWTTRGRLTLAVSAIVYQDTPSNRALLSGTQCTPPSIAPVTIDGEKLGDGTSISLTANIQDQDGYVAVEGRRQEGTNAPPPGGSEAGPYNEAGTDQSYYHDFTGPAPSADYATFEFEPYQKPSFKIVVDEHGWASSSGTVSRQSEFSMTELHTQSAWQMWLTLGASLLGLTAVIFTIKRMWQHLKGHAETYDPDSG